jgi:hypothetical protein
MQLRGDETSAKEHGITWKEEAKEQAGLDKYDCSDNDVEDKWGKGCKLRIE